MVHPRSDFPIGRNSSATNYDVRNELLTPVTFMPLFDDSCFCLQRSRCEEDFHRLSTQSDSL